MAFALVFGSVLLVNVDGFSLEEVGFVVGCFVLASFIFFSKQRAFDHFLIDDTGIVIGSKTFSFTSAIDYHWLGEDQGERVGLFKMGGAMSLDPIDPNALAATKVARVNVRKWLFFTGYVNLEVDDDKAVELQNILEQHGVRHRSRWRGILGI